MMNTYTTIPSGSPHLRRWFPRSEMERLLALSMCFSCILVALRMFYTGKNTFLFLVWNLFLAFIPYAITRWLGRRSVVRPTPSFILVAAIWLVFIPNAFYIITDLFHLGDYYNDRRMPSWFDLAMILSFAWNGLLLGTLSVRQMEKLIRPMLPAACTMVFIYPFLIMVLNALGVYIGRYLRFNSWDILTNPFELFGDIAAMIWHPLQYGYAWGMVLCYSILMTLFYQMLKKISKALD
jgi:uncharacterized membrane protein